MLNTVTKVLFEKYRGDTFSLSIGHSDYPAPLSLILVEVNSLGQRQATAQQGVRQEPFSIIFRGPAEPVLKQGMFPISHPELGEFEGLFIVPVGANEEGVFYEAVFN